VLWALLRIELAAQTFGGQLTGLLSE